MALALKEDSKVRLIWHAELIFYLSLTGLCPDGQLSGSKGARYVLASAEESWRKAQDLAVRVKDLEHALEQTYALVSDQRHPLLTPELLKIGQDPRAIVVKAESDLTPPAEELPIAAFGTMKISKSGNNRWLGVSTPHLLFRKIYINLSR